MSFPTHRLPSWATFSSMVIAASRRSTRSASGRAVSCHGLSAGTSVTAQLLYVSETFSVLTAGVVRSRDVPVLCRGCGTDAHCGVQCRTAGGALTPSGRNPTLTKPHVNLQSGHESCRLWDGDDRQPRRSARCDE